MRERMRSETKEEEGSGFYDWRPISHDVQAARAMLAHQQSRPARALPIQERRDQENLHGRRSRWTGVGNARYLDEGTKDRRLNCT